MMRVTVKIYGLSGVIIRELSLPEGATCASALERVLLGEKDPPVLSNLSYMLNGQRAGADTRLSQGDTVIVLSALAGG